MAIIKDTHETNTYTPESGIKSLETHAEEARVIDALSTEVVNLHETMYEPADYDAAVMNVHESTLQKLGEHADKNTVDVVTLIAAGAVTNPHLHERLFRTAELEMDEELLSVWTQSLDIRQKADNADAEQHALDSLLDTTVAKCKENEDKVKGKAAVSRVSALGIGLLSHHPQLAAKFAGYLVDAS